MIEKSPKVFCCFLSETLFNKAMYIFKSKIKLFYKRFIGSSGEKSNNAVNTSNYEETAGRKLISCVVTNTIPNIHSNFQIGNRSSIHKHFIYLFIHVSYMISGLGRVAYTDRIT